MTLHRNHRTIIGDPQSAEGRANRQTFVGASEVTCYNCRAAMDKRQ